jgi:glyoxylase-like metal-dependent hydrolase (beta-lactamase superfamily II)
LSDFATGNTISTLKEVYKSRMFKEYVKILREGDQNGNGLIFKVTPPTGPEIFGLGTKNYYGGNWDLGPTWNYLVLADKPFLLDTGRTGLARKLLEMIEYTGFPVRSLQTVALSHGHEDHDGALADIVKLTGATVKAHPIYEKLVKQAPDKVPEGIRNDFPPSCWQCPMPLSFVDQNCIDYHQSRNNLIVEDICDQEKTLGQGIEVIYLPGHSPDAVAISIGSEIVFVGDNVMPQISPAPSKKESFHQLSAIFPENQSEIQSAFGLEAYLKSLKKLIALGESRPNVLAFPAHRIFYDNRWNDFSLEKRAKEIVEHHVQRCGDILEILKTAPKTVEEIAVDYFEPSLLEGVGSRMAKREIKSHLEFLADCSDIEQTDANHYYRSGTEGFESHIRALESW